MRVGHILPFVIASSEALRFRDLAEKSSPQADAPTDITADITADPDHRDLQSNCFGDTLPDPEWHPTYSAGWTRGFCQFNRDCNSPGYPTEVACCNAAYASQASGFCFSNLPSPPTMSPTDVGGLDVYYPDYTLSWLDGVCTNARPLPSGRPTYDTPLACCKAAYPGQISGACFAELPTPPTSAPTSSDFTVDFWYADEDTPWAQAGCKNTLPLPLRVIQNSDPSRRYSSQILCCKGNYGGQFSGVCLSQLPSPPTLSPTDEGGLDFWYPDYDTSWAVATCLNTRPIPFSPGGRPTYSSDLECCQGAYAGQASGTCLAALVNPPTSAPTSSDFTVDFWYPDYETAWEVAMCLNTRPVPFGPGGRPTYPTKRACCQGAYAGQSSGVCLGLLISPPTMAPTSTGGLDVFYPDYTLAFGEGQCINDRPLPSGRPTYVNKQMCCSGAYGGQSSDNCLCDAVGVCFSCRCGSEADRVAAGGCPDLTCS
eukprot:CAMPEP_0201682426 /NCGR_PEP_ID=MMETSP0494-20130426/51614_1 /ASSEMBLY_ACC=CAM_ASM_000839 /TAXON_ID=420259 /ORGANISM="Thalassiosira gravida, Strain GMp14c1" /LENGTH=482 /DNA_ID=CAMNT_0048166185 /DNA_START=132 /DNA_END=1580 /DNA_ORIENTATION=-